MNLEEGLLGATSQNFALDSPTCTPVTEWGAARKSSVVFIAVVVGLVTLTWIPETLHRTYDAGVVIEVLAFHLLVVLLLAAYGQSIWVDPGTVPEAWSDFIARLPSSERARHTFCPKSQQYKPPRAHFCTATSRLVLNMDHFCPWIANTVGFYNRKFFVQFLVYAAISLLFGAISLMARAAQCLHQTAGEGSPSLGCGMLLYLAAFFDSVLGTIMLCFAGFHIYLVLTNRTSIEIAQSRFTPSEAGFNMGYRHNWIQVFGHNPIYWWLPLWGDGPVGDGINWPTPTGSQSSSACSKNAIEDSFEDGEDPAPMEPVEENSSSDATDSYIAIQEDNT